MHIITNCSRCGNDFMYHSSDTHLERDITIVDEVGNNEVITAVICQDCDYVEKFAKDALKWHGIKDFEHYKEVALEMWENGELNELSEAGFTVVDSREYREDGTLSRETVRMLTEKEFNSRFNENN